MKPLEFLLRCRVNRSRQTTFTFFHRRRTDLGRGIYIVLSSWCTSFRLLCPLAAERGVAMYTHSPHGCRSHAHHVNMTLAPRFRSPVGHDIGCVLSTHTGTTDTTQSSQVQIIAKGASLWVSGTIPLPEPSVFLVVRTVARNLYQLLVCLSALLSRWLQP
ncbi:hypothetical protein BD413DRAFT_32434 [Trametes elegans]|nr:hypothetical protein BD413DRAFT_32434 [Trametes elegans]